MTYDIVHSCNNGKKSWPTIKSCRRLRSVSINRCFVRVQAVIISITGGTGPLVFGVHLLVPISTRVDRFSELKIKTLHVIRLWIDKLKNVHIFCIVVLCRVVVGLIMFLGVIFCDI